MKTKENQYLLLLGFILFYGFIMRFWNLFSIPFTFDELSAMGRTTFDSFSEMIKVGVIERDTHPAGIQTFLYYWTKLFGEREFVIKMPFLIAGFVSIYLSYRIGEIWFGKTIAILTAAYVSSLQLFIMYSQIARPYISGLFFTLFAVLYWSKYFFQAPKLKYLIGFVMFSSLAAYNHYFSLLFIAVLGFSGLLFVNRKNLVPYIISGFLICILYIPHFSVIFAQAEKGSIGGWLGAPGPYFLINFLFWLFHDSFYVIFIFLMVIIAGWILKTTPIRVKDRNKKRIVLSLWLLPAPIFGYIYSLTVEPILQNSLLIFSTPYLFILLFSYAGTWKTKYLYGAVTIILLVNTLTLVITKQYYKTFYKQPFNQLVENAVELDRNNKNGVFIINDYTPYYTNYYFRKYDYKLPFFTTRNSDISIVSFKEILAGLNQDMIITSGLDDIYFQLINEQYPYWIAYENGFTYEQYTFSRNKTDKSRAIEKKLISETSFNDEHSIWKFNRDNVQQDQSFDNSHYYLMSENVDYGSMFEIPLKDIVDNIYWIIDVELELKTDQLQIGAILVGEIKEGEEMVSWKGSAFSDFGIQADTIQSVYLTMDIQKAMNNKNRVGDQLLRFYIWNREHNRFQIRKIKIFLRSGNPSRYVI